MSKECSNVERACSKSNLQQAPWIIKGQLAAP